MEISTNDLLPLIKTLAVLKPYLSEIVIVGGWVPILYRRYGKVPARHPSVRTMDLDIAVPRRLDEGKRQTIDELLSGAGYKSRILGSDFPVVKYELSSPAVEIEFLTPEVGRPGGPSLTVQRGLTAQTLRYLQILLDNTEEIVVNETLPEVGVAAAVRVPSPGAFIYQKGLVLPSRQSKASKDLYYILDLLDSSPEVREAILVELKRLRSLYAARWFRSFLRNLNEYFAGPSAKGPALLATQYSGPMPIEAFKNYANRIFRDFIQYLGGVAA